MTRETRREALMQQINSGKMESDSARILDYYKNLYPGGSIAPFVGQRLGIKGSSTVKARITQLLDLGILKCGGKLKHQGYNHTVFLYEPDPERWDTLADVRHYDKFQIWIARGENEFGVDPSLFKN
jgi:hypothetical protein